MERKLNVSRVFSTFFFSEIITESMKGSTVAFELFSILNFLLSNGTATREDLQRPSASRAHWDKHT